MSFLHLGQRKEEEQEQPEQPIARAVDVAWLNQQYNNINSHFKEWATLFRKQAGFNQILSNLRTKLGHSWRRFELEFPLRQLKEKLAAIISNPPETTTEAYHQLLIEKDNELREGVLVAARKKAQNESSNDERIIELVQISSENKGKRRQQVIGMTGDETSVIETVDEKAQNYRRISYLIVFVAIEFIINMGIYQGASNLKLSIGLSTATILGLLVPALFFAVFFNRWIRHRDAKKAFYQNYPGGFDEDGNRVKLFLLSDMVAYMWISTLVILVCVCLLLGIGRHLLALLDRFNSPMQVAGNIALIILTWVVVIIEIQYAPKYDNGQLEEYRKLDTACNEAEQEIERRTQPSEVEEPFQNEIARLKKRYFQALDDAEERARTQEKEFRAARNQFEPRYQEYKAAWNDLHDSRFRALTSSLVTEIFDSHKKTVDPAQFKMEAILEEHSAAFEIAVRPTLLDEGFAERVRNFDPHVELPTNLRLTKFEDIIAEAEKQAAAEMAAQAPTKREFQMPEGW